MFMSYGIFLFIHVYMVAIENIDDDIINQLHFLFCKKKNSKFCNAKNRLVMHPGILGIDRFKCK